jgi:hypothetical protein
MDADRRRTSTGADYCYACDAMRTAVSENRYLRQVHDSEEQERCAARKRMGLDGQE